MSVLENQARLHMEDDINRNGHYAGRAETFTHEPHEGGQEVTEAMDTAPAVSHPTILPTDTPMPATQNRTLLGADLSGLMRHSPLGPDGGVLGTASAPGISLRVEQTPTEFSHLYAALERQAPGLGSLSGLGEGMPNGTSYVLGVTSAAAGEGKTTVALHLAMTMARDTFKKVCLLDMSFGTSDLSARLGVPASGEGVVSVLEASGTVVPTLQLAGCDNLVIIPAGREPQNAARLARSPRVEQLLVSARFAFDVVIVDLPSVASDNAGPLARAMDGIVVVVRAGATPQAVVSRALDMLGRDKVLGVTLNRVPPAGKAKKGRAK